MVFKYFMKAILGKSGAQEHESRGGIVGYLGLPDNAASGALNLEPGSVIDNKTEAPPWIIVDHDLLSMNIPNWPIRLWKVQALKPIKPQGHRGNYTRCSAIKVLEHLPNYRVFGETDTGIVDVIEFAQRLTLNQAKALSDLRASTAPDTYSGAWVQWISKNGIARDGYSDDFDEVLSIGRSKGDSPVGSGLLLISRVLFDQAGRVDAEKAYEHADDGTPYLAGPWDRACSTLKDAAMSFGASDLFDPAGIAEMRRPLRQVSPDLVRRIEDKLKKIVV